MIHYHSHPFTLKEFKIEVTHRCELSCIHCSSDARPSNRIEIPVETCLRILKEAAGLGAKEVAFSGGEPLCWPHIYEAIEAAVKDGLVVIVYTSGNTNNFGQKAEQIYRLGARKFIFSMFGGTETSHERVTRVAGSFGRTLKAISDAENIGIGTEIHFVPMSSNYRELKEVASLSKGHGASVVSVLRLVPQGRAALLRGGILNRVQNLELRRQIQALRESGYQIRTGSPYNFLMLSANPKCCSGIDRLIIGPDLRLYPCDAFKQLKAEELVGTKDLSTLNNSTLAACWDKSPYLERVREYLTTPFADPCASCGLLEKCLSGCLAQKVIAYGNLEKRPDPDCLGTNFRGDDI